MTTNKIIEIPFIGDTIIKQQTDGGLIDISSIVDLVNEKRLRQGKAEVRINHYFESDNAQVYLEALLKDAGISSVYTLTGNQATSFSLENQDVTVIEEQKKITIKELKEIGLYKDTRGKNAGTWFTPLLALDIVGWLDPEIRLQFNKIVMKELFKTRIMISESNKIMTDAIQLSIGKQETTFWSQVSYELNKKVIGESYPGIRNSIDGDEMKQMQRLMTKITMMAEEGMFEDREDVINSIKRAKI